MGKRLLVAEPESTQNTASQHEACKRPAGKFVFRFVLYDLTCNRTDSTTIQNVE